MTQRSVVILSGVRTAIGDYGGSLKDIAPTDLGARAVREAIARAKVDPNDPGTWGKVSRNATCPCGSGKKYKHCHGRFA